MKLICNKNVWRMYCQLWLITTLKLAGSYYYWHVFFQKKRILSCWTKQDHKCCTAVMKGTGDALSTPSWEPGTYWEEREVLSVCWSWTTSQYNHQNSPRGHYRRVTAQHSCMPLLRESHNCRERLPLNRGWTNRGLELVSVPPTNQQGIYLMMHREIKMVITVKVCSINQLLSERILLRNKTC